MISNTTAFLYRWTQLSTRMWYVGSRTAKGCHPNDGYLCSSKIVKPLILEHTDDWVREILVIGPPEFIAELERTYLKTIDAKNNPLSYNGHNGDGLYSRAGVAPWNKGKESPTKGIARLDGTKLKISKSHKNKKKSDSHVKNMSLSRKGKLPWNKGIIESPEIRAKKKEAAKCRVKTDLFVNAVRSAAKKRIGKPSPIKGKSMPPGQAQKISEYQKGRPKLKQVCRLIDKKEMNLSHFNQWINRLQEK